MLKQQKWNPYLAGALAGVLLVLSVLIAHQFYGASTTFPRLGSWLEKLVGINVEKFDYFTTKNGKYGPGSLPNWQLLFHLGILIGAFLSAWLSNSFKIVTVPSRWKEVHGANWPKRMVWAVIGGIILIIGARMAGGCPSGHGLSGVAQLAASGLLALPFFFLGGVISANILLKKRS